MGNNEVLNLSSSLGWDAEFQPVFTPEVLPVSAKACSPLRNVEAVLQQDQVLGGDEVWHSKGNWVLVKVVRMILQVAIWWDQPCFPRE